MSREIDARVAVEVMGWKRRWPAVLGGKCREINKNTGYMTIHRESDDAWNVPTSGGGTKRVVGCPHYSTTWEAMGLVVEKIKHLEFDLTFFPGSGWHVNLGNYVDGVLNFDSVVEEVAETAPMAVALIALKVMEK